MRIFLVFALGALAFPATADDALPATGNNALEKQLSAIEARVAELRAEVKREQALAAERKARMAALDKQIAAARAKDRRQQGKP